MIAIEKATPPKMPFLRQMRLKHGLSQSKLAGLVGCDVFRVSAWELGRNTPSLSYQVKLAQVFKMPLLQLQKGCDWEQTPDLMIKGLEG